MSNKQTAFLLGTFLTLFIITMPVYASDDFVVTLNYRTNLSSEKIRSLIRLKNRLYVDKRPLTEDDILIGQHWIQILLSLQESRLNFRNCFAGSFALVITENRNKKIEEGCLEDDRFQMLSGSFEHLLNLAQE